MYFDGVVNMSGNEACTVIIAPSEKQYLISIKLQFVCTNIIANIKSVSID
jgi:hypothetical protein